MILFIFIVISSLGYFNNLNQPILERIYSATVGFKLNPLQDMTGNCGYFGNVLSSSDNSHSQK